MSSAAHSIRRGDSTTFSKSSIPVKAALLCAIIVYDSAALFRAVGYRGRRWTGLGGCHAIFGPLRRLPSESTITICHTLGSAKGAICSSSRSNRRERFLLDHQCRSTPRDTWQLVAQRLTRSGRHHEQHIFPIDSLYRFHSDCPARKNVLGDNDRRGSCEYPIRGFQ
jgi:hypothetical protein